VLSSWLWRPFSDVFAITSLINVTKITSQNFSLLGPSPIKISGHGSVMYYFCVMKITKGKLRHVKLIGLPDCFCSRRIMYRGACISKSLCVGPRANVVDVNTVQQINKQTNKQTLVIGKYLNSKIFFFVFTSIDSLIWFCEKLV